MTPEQRKRLLAVLPQADDSASDDVLMLSAIQELEATAPAIENVTNKIAELKDENDQLKTALSAAESERDEKGRQVLSLSANQKAPDPEIASGIGELVDGKFEAAIAAGLPAKAIDALKPLLRDGNGGLTALALSACPVVAGKKPARLSVAIADWALKLAAGEYGPGVATGFVPGNVGLLKMAADDKGNSVDTARAEGEAFQKAQQASRGLVPIS